MQIERTLQFRRFFFSRDASSYMGDTNHTPKNLWRKLSLTVQKLQNSQTFSPLKVFNYTVHEPHPLGHFKNPSKQEEDNRWQTFNKRNLIVNADDLHVPEIIYRLSLHAHPCTCTADAVIKVLLMV